VQGEGGNHGPIAKSERKEKKGKENILLMLTGKWKEGHVTMQRRRVRKGSRERLFMTAGREVSSVSKKIGLTRFANLRN